MLLSIALIAQLHFWLLSQLQRFSIFAMVSFIAVLYGECFNFQREMCWIDGCLGLFCILPLISFTL